MAAAYAIRSAPPSTDAVRAPTAVRTPSSPWRCRSAPRFARNCPSPPARYATSAPSTRRPGGGPRPVSSPAPRDRPRRIVRETPPPPPHPAKNAPTPPPPPVPIPPPTPPPPPFPALLAPPPHLRPRR